MKHAIRSILHRQGEFPFYADFRGKDDWFGCRSSGEVNHLDKEQDSISSK